MSISASLNYNLVNKINPVNILKFNTYIQKIGLNRYTDSALVAVRHLDNYQDDSNKTTKIR